MSSQILKIYPRHLLKTIFLTLTIMYVLCLAGTGLAIMAYEKYLGNSSPVQGWLNQNATSYSTDIYDTLLAIKDVSIAHREAIADRRSQKSQLGLREKIELLEGVLEIFEPNNDVGRRISTYISSADAMKSVKEFHHLVTGWANSSQKIANVAIFTAEENALIAMRRLATEAIQKEFQARDEMVIAINSSRMLADKALYIGTVLFVFGLLALVSVYWASQAWISAEKERFERLEYLLSTVGHDLRSPLQAIVSCAQLLRKSYISGDNKTYIDIVKDSSEQLSRLVDDLVGLTRNEKLSFEPHSLDLTFWINKITARFTVDAERKGLTFAVSSVPNELSAIYFDEMRLTQCVGNLLSNAIRYTDSGSIKLTVNHIKNSVDDGVLLIKIEDTGSGIADKDRTRIFMPFERASSKAHGKGLGLAIVSSIVHAAHGEISLKSTFGVGSTFSIWLPVTYPKQLASPVTLAPTMAIRTQHEDYGKVLIVDDDPALCTVFSRVIADMGYLSDKASCGEEGFKLASNTRYHAIITDIQMPGWDGFKLAQECREKLHPCPILIALTAYTKTLSNDPRAGIFDKILYKPIDDELLLAALDSGADSVSLSR